jgi:tetratricopeptide (TPR) repeat protein
MKKSAMRILICVLLLLSGVSAVAQKGADSKKKQYSNLKGRAADVDALIDEAEAAVQSSPKLALEKVKEALAVSISNQDTHAEARCYNLLGQINADILEWKLSLENFLTAKEKLSMSKVVDSGESIRSLLGVATAYLRLNRFDEALTAVKEINNFSASYEQKADAAILTSEVYVAMQDYQNALNALNHIPSRKVRDASLDTRIDNQRARIYARMKQVDRASEILQSSQAKPRAGNSAAVSRAEADDAQSAKEEISSVYQEQKRYDDEIELRLNSIEYNMDNNNLSEVSKDKVELSKALVAKGEDAEAIRELEEAAFIADTIGDPRRQAIAYLSLADLYEKRGNPSRAIETYRKYSKAVAKTEEQSSKKLLEKSELIKTQRDIEELSKYIAVEKQKETLAQAMVSRQRLIIYGLVLIILIVGVTSYFIYKNAVASKVANQLLALKSLRSQMNPHFIFNALNSVNHFVSQNDERTTNKFLSEFSRLMRLVMENSQEDFIPLFKEEEIIALYLKLEHYRFRDKFEYEITVDDHINKEAVEIPPMLIQPYIENAVWHGLRYKETKGFLSVKITSGVDELVITITDNGIGRKKSAELKTQNQRKHNSTGLRNIRERLGIINKVYRSNYRVDISDLEAESGTRVTLHIPVKTKTKVYA